MNFRIAIVNVLALFGLLFYTALANAAASDPTQVNMFKPHSGAASAANIPPPNMPPPPGGAGLPPSAGAPAPQQKYVGRINGTAVYRTDETYRFEPGTGLTGGTPR